MNKQEIQLMIDLIEKSAAKARLARYNLREAQTVLLGAVRQLKYLMEKEEE